ncbi:proline--tRNA ligase-like [Octopus sinensis]|uniref:Proline--tRNA ligase-like n=1 Tax=Octopus sinensis TaxID=2607531 RepID=A0A6P7U0I7_9MOLL|nr:proline--tRNA ligase-like [Octopus sinensis]
MFKIDFQDPVDGSSKFVYQNSWGLTTRTIGVMVMVHSDDHGLILPPRVAPVQVVIMSCGLTSSTSQEVVNVVTLQKKYIYDQLIGGGIRVECDDRENRTSGWKFSYHELRVSLYSYNQGSST